MNKEEAKLASEKLDQLLEKWREDEISDIEFCEFAIPHIKMISAYFEKEETPGEEKKKSLYEDLEKDLDKEDGDPALFDPEKEKEAEEMLEGKEEDLEKEEESDTEEEES